MSTEKKIIHPPSKGYNIHVVFHKDSVMGDVWVAKCRKVNGVVGYGTSWIEAVEGFAKNFKKGDDKQ